MKQYGGYILLAIATLLALGARSARWLAGVVSPTRLREDAQGSGRYGATRAGGRIHMGTDLVVSPGQPVYAPMPGRITRIAYPYASDLQWKGLEMALDNGMVMKIFYMQPDTALIGAQVGRGDVIGYAQDISRKYRGGMLDHIHVELLQDGRHINPEPYIF